MLDANLVTLPGPRTGGRPVISSALAAPLAIVAVLAGLIAAALGLVVAGGEAATGVDRAVQNVVWTLWPVRGEGAYFIDFLGDPRTIAGGAAVVAVVALVTRRLRCAVVAVLAPVVTGVITTLAKDVVGRTIHGPDNLAFPSGHTAAFTSVAAVALLLVIGVAGSGRVVGTVVLVAGSVAIGSIMAVDQIAIDAHYPTDTLGGLCTALAIAAAVAFAVDAGANVLSSAVSSRRARR